MKKQTIRLNESQLYNLVKKAIINTINESVQGNAELVCYGRDDLLDVAEKMANEYGNPGEDLCGAMADAAVKFLSQIRLNPDWTAETLNEGESGGWVVEPSEAEEAYNMFAAELGNEEANAAIVRALGNSALSDVLAYLFRMYDFREWDNRGHD